MNNSVLVTGANGFIGKRLCRKISDSGYHLRRAVRSGSAEADVVVQDIGPHSNWADALRGVDCVIHLAAQIDISRKTAEESLSRLYRVNVDGTLNLAKQAAASGVRRFIYLSTVKVNGEETFHHKTSHDACAKNQAVFTEQDIANPQDLYAVSKAEAERKLMELALNADIEVVIIRPPLVYGPGIKGNLSLLVRCLQRGLPLPLRSLTDNRRSLVALDNLIDMIMICKDHPSASNQTFLVSDGEDLSTTELLRRISSSIGMVPKLFPVPPNLLEMGLAMFGRRDLATRLCGSLQVDITKAHDLLGWRAPISVDEGLERMSKDFIRC